MRVVFHRASVDLSLNPRPSALLIRTFFIFGRCCARLSHVYVPDLLFTCSPAAAERPKRGISAARPRGSTRWSQPPGNSRSRREVSGKGDFLGARLLSHGRAGTPGAPNSHGLPNDSHWTARQCVPRTSTPALAASSALFLRSGMGCGLAARPPIATVRMFSISDACSLPSPRSGHFGTLCGGVVLVIQRWVDAYLQTSMG